MMTPFAMRKRPLVMCPGDYCDRMSPRGECVDELPYSPICSFTHREAIAFKWLRAWCSISVSCRELCVLRLDFTINALLCHTVIVQPRLAPTGSHVRSCKPSFKRLARPLLTRLPV